jgi:hypothetical protein
VSYFKHEHSILFVSMRFPRRLKIWKRPKTLAAVIIVLLFIGAGVMTVRNLNSPAEGIISNPSDQASKSARQQPDSRTYKDAYLSFDYPSAYVSRLVDHDTSYLDRVNLVAGHPKNRFAAIALARQNIANDSGVSYRRSHPELYKNVLSLPQELVFSKLDQMEYTGFLVHGDEVLSISLTSVAPEDLSADYNKMVNSLRWAQ